MKEVFTNNEIEAALKRRVNGIKTYFELMKGIEKSIIDETKYRNFYKMNRGRFSPDFYEEYFNCLKEYLKREDIKQLKSTDVEKIAPIFEETLRRLKDKSGRVEASFSSKLLSTVNPNLAVWDGNVLSHLDKDKVKAPYSNKDKDIQIGETVRTYKALNNAINDLINNEGEQYIKIFDKVVSDAKLECDYPLSKVTPTKKIDLVLWSLGKKSKK